MNYLQTLTSLVFFMLATLLTGCSDDEDDNDRSPGVEVGRFEAEVSGAIEKELSGESFFLYSIDTDANPPFSSLRIDLSTAENDRISLRVDLRNNTNGVPPGLYDVQDPDNFITITYTTPSGEVYFASEEGLIEIVEFEGELLWGTFSGELVEINNNTITLEGEFNADEY